MTPKEYADYLVNTVWVKANSTLKNEAINLSIILVDELIKAQPLNPYYGGYYETIQDRVDSVIEYLKEVKNQLTHLNNL